MIARAVTNTEMMYQAILELYSSTGGHHHRVVGIVQGLLNVGHGSLSSSPSAETGEWATMQQQQQALATQRGQAQRLHAALAHTPGLQRVSLEQASKPPLYFHPCQTHRELLSLDPGP